MCELYDSLSSMTNVELNNLARNRFLPNKFQEWLAEFGNYAAKKYLCENENLSDEVASRLWRGRSIVVKSLLVSNANITDEEKITTLFNLYKRNMNAPGYGWWRFRCTFVSNPWAKTVGYSGKKIQPATPAPLLYEVYKMVKENDHRQQSRRSQWYSGQHRGIKHSILRHNNIDVKLAVVMSTDQDPEIKKVAFRLMAALST